MPPKARPPLFRLVPVVALLAALAASVWPSPSRCADFFESMEQRRREEAALMESATVCVLARGEDGMASGSGFFVGEGLILTNAHVVDEADEHGVYVLGWLYLEGRVVEKNPPLAWAYLSLAAERLGEVETDQGAQLPHLADKLLSAREGKTARKLQADTLPHWARVPATNLRPWSVAYYAYPAAKDAPRAVPHLFPWSHPYEYPAKHRPASAGGSPSCSLPGFRGRGQSAPKNFGRGHDPDRPRQQRP